MFNFNDFTFLKLKFKEINISICFYSINKSKN